MTVLRNMPQQLILAHAPWGLGAFLIICIVGCSAAGLTLVFAGQTAGLLTILLGAGIPVVLFGALVKRDQVIFDAVAGQITLQRRSLWGYGQSQHDLDALDQAQLQELADTARPVLIFGTTCIPLVEAYRSGNAPATTVKAINTWLNDLREAPQIAL